MVRRAEELLTILMQEWKAYFPFLENLHPGNREMWLSVRERVLSYEPVYSHNLSDLPESCPSANRDTKAVIYMDDRFDFALRANVGLLSRKLGDDWRFHIWHSENSGFVRQAPLDRGLFFHRRSLKDFTGGFDPRQESALPAYGSQRIP